MGAAVEQPKSSGKQEFSWPKGYRGWGIAAGIKKNSKPDLGILSSEPPAQAFGVFTRNAFKAAPVLQCQAVLAGKNTVSHILVNSGNANACTGERGLSDARRCCEYLNEKSRSPAAVLMCSTGVIGEFLPVDKVLGGIDRLLDVNSSDYAEFHECILTTDKVEKLAEKTFHFSLGEVRISGCAKGAGMIQPNMATMLAYIATDIALPADFQASFFGMVERSFNSISVDGDMSTNDTAILLANGASGIAFVDLNEIEQKTFTKELDALCISLARQIVRDGEGATTCIQIHVEGAKSETEAKLAARTIANSPLVKTAFYGRDPNWGRVVAALGSQELSIHPDQVDVYFCGTLVFTQGMATEYDEKALKEKMEEPELELNLNLYAGNSTWTYWTCDLTNDYININASYRS